MTLLAPGFLFLLLAGALVMLLHTTRPRERTVSALLLWKRLAAEEKGTNWRLRWPELSLPLVLQLLALLLLVAALAHPLFGEERDVEHWIYVVDNSITAQAIADGGPNHADTLAFLTQRLNMVTEPARFSLIAAGAVAKPVFARQKAQPQRFTALLENLKADDGPADWAGVERLVQAIARPDEITHLVALGAVPELGGDFSDLRRSDPLVPTSVPNAFLSARIEEAPDGALMLRGLVSFDGGLDRSTLTARFTPDSGEAETVASIDVLARYGRADFVLPLTLDGAGILSVGLSEDANPADNETKFVLLEAPRPLTALYIGGAQGPEPPLLRALAASGVAVTRGDAYAEGYDLAVVDGAVLPAAPEVPTIWIGAARLADDPASSALLDTTPDQLIDHSLGRGWNWRDLQIASAFALPERSGMQPVLIAETAPIIAARETEHGRDIHLAFDPAQSNWSEKAGFVVFTAAALDWMGLKSSGRVEPACMVGVPCQLDTRLSGSVLEGAGERVLPQARFVPDQAGLFTLRKDDLVTRIAVHPQGTPTLTRDSSPVPAAPFGLWPWLLGAGLAVLVVEFLLARRSPIGWRWSALILRGTALLFGALALFDTPLPLWRDDGAVIGVADAGTAAMPVGQTVALGADLALTMDDSGGKVFSGWGADGLRLAAALLPLDLPGRLAIASTAFAADTELSTGDIAVDAFALSPGAPADVIVTALEAPAQIFVGDAFALSATIMAGASVTAQLTATANGEPLADLSIALQPGSNRIDVAVPEATDGTATYQITASIPGDPEPANNMAGVAVHAYVPRPIAIISPQAAQAASFAEMLEGQGLEANLLAPADLPTDADGWQRFAGAVLMNVPAIDLTIAQQEVLEAAVLDDGLGLFILGGANSFGPGGYLETPLDRLSPISSRVPRDRPGVALVFVLDRSSSMTQEVGPVTRLDIAKQATIDAINLLNDDSQVAVVTFDSSARLSLPMSRVTEKDFIARSINQVRSGGGTAMYKGLTAGFDQLRNVDAAARHILVMTDGLSQPADFAGLMQNIRAAGITVSSVAIGEESELELVEQIAREGGGAFHATTDFAALPSILSQEAMMLAGEPIETVTTVPQWVDQDMPFLDGVPETWPAIDGYVLTTPKAEATPLATVIDTTGKPVPFLSTWRYGNGQVLALTTDVAGDWSREWRQSESFPRLFAQGLRQFLSAPPEELPLTVTRRGDTLLVEVESENAQPVVEMLGPTGASSDLVLRRVDENRYGAEIVPEMPGTYTFTATLGAVQAETALFVSYPARLDWSHPDLGPAQVALATGGAVIEPGAAYSPQFPGRWSAISIWPWLIVLSLFFFIIDLVVRYGGHQFLARFRAHRHVEQG